MASIIKRLDIAIQQVFKINHPCRYGFDTPHQGSALTMTGNSSILLMKSVFKKLLQNINTLFKYEQYTGHGECSAQTKSKTNVSNHDTRNLFCYIKSALWVIIAMLFLCPCNGASQDPLNRRALIGYLDDPEVCAFLDMISYAEGTMSENGYRLIYSYEEFTCFNDHPRCVVCAPSNGTTLCSSAAGRYQISQAEWDRISTIIGAKDFSPLNQDCAAVFLLIRSGALAALKAGKFGEAVSKVRKIWASMPDAPYNQPTKKEQDLYRVYQKQLLIHRNRLSHRRSGGGRS